MGVIEDDSWLLDDNYSADKKSSYIISERPFVRGEKCLRRDYSDGFTELYFYDTERACWLVEGYRNKKILGMPYDFERCLSSNVLCGLYLESVKIIKDKKHFPKFSS
jgi:hypothetical protein